MTTREASCSCGQLRVVVTGDPVRVPVCHCLACQRRTGSTFGYQARFVRAAATVSGRSTGWSRDSDDGEATYTQHFCPDCRHAWVGLPDDLIREDDDAPSPAGGLD